MIAPRMMTNHESGSRAPDPHSHPTNATKPLSTFAKTMLESLKKMVTSWKKDVYKG
jgi:hypothetical protein